jgi:hypothetical protein
MPGTGLALCRLGQGTGCPPNPPHKPRPPAHLPARLRPVAPNHRLPNTQPRLPTHPLARLDPGTYPLPPNKPSARAGPPTFLRSASSSFPPMSSRLPNSPRLFTRTGATVTPTDVERRSGFSNSTSAPAPRASGMADPARRVRGVDRALTRPHRPLLWSNICSHRVSAAAAAAAHLLCPSCPTQTEQQGCNPAWRCCTPPARHLWLGLPPLLGALQQRQPRRYACREPHADLRMPPPCHRWLQLGSGIRGLLAPRRRHRPPAPAQAGSAPAAASSIPRLPHHAAASCCPAGSVARGALACVAATTGAVLCAPALLCSVREAPGRRVKSRARCMVVPTCSASSAAMSGAAVAALPSQRRARTCPAAAVDLAIWRAGTRRRCIAGTSSAPPCSMANQLPIQPQEPGPGARDRAGSVGILAVYPYFPSCYVRHQPPGRGAASAGCCDAHHHAPRRMTR